MRGYIRMCLSWLRHIVKRTAFRLYKSLLIVLLRLIRHCQCIVDGQERVFQERGLALSSQPVINQDSLMVSVTLAVPLLQAPLQSQRYQAGPNIQSPTPQLQGFDDVVCNTQSPGNSSGPSIPSPMPEPSIAGVATPPPSAAPGQTSDIILIPIVPDEVRRYERNVPVKDEYLVFEVKKGPLDCSEEQVPVKGWEPLTQPEGALIFYHPYKRVFTDADVRNSETADNIDKAVEKAYREAHNAGISLDDFDELTLELMTGDGKEWGYYFANHRRRVIFWFEDHTSYSLMSGVRGVEHKSHVRYALSTQYWAHVALFPNRRSLPEDVVVELKEMIVQAQADYITSDSSIAPFPPDKIASMLSLVDLLMNSVNKEREHSVWIAARFMIPFCSAKFVNFCGQPGARLDVDRSIYGDSDTRSKKTFLRVMNIILFGFPHAQRDAIHKIWVDGITTPTQLKNFINRFTAERNAYTTFSTVMLAVDVSFLAVPSVQTQTSATLLTYLATLCTMGSLVVSLIFTAQASNIQNVSFIVNLSSETLAFALSLPFPLLIWGMAFFAAALSIMIFSTSGVVTVAIASPLLAAIFILAMFPILAVSGIHISRLMRWIIVQVQLFRIRHAASYV